VQADVAERPATLEEALTALDGHVTGG
jgi:hypothetical protein